jgi:hypothetical protein
MTPAYAPAAAPVDPSVSFFLEVAGTGGEEILHVPGLSFLDEDDDACGGIGSTSNGSSGIGKIDGGCNGNGGGHGPASGWEQHDAWPTSTDLCSVFEPLPPQHRQHQNHQQQMQQPGQGQQQPQLGQGQQTQLVQGQQTQQPYQQTQQPHQQTQQPYQQPQQPYQQPQQPYRQTHQHPLHQAQPGPPAAAPMTGLPADPAIVQSFARGTALASAEVPTEPAAGQFAWLTGEGDPASITGCIEDNHN